MMGEVISLLAGMALLFLGGLCMVAYRPVGWRTALTTPAGVLGIAVFLSFLAHVGNTLYWQVFGHVAIHGLGLVSVYQLRAVGDYLDLIFKGSGAVAAYLHLYALRLRLDPEERKNWSVLGMAFYPEKFRLFSNVLGRRDQ